MNNCRALHVVTCVYRGFLSVAFPNCCVYMLTILNEGTSLELLKKKVPDCECASGSCSLAAYSL